MSRIYYRSAKAAIVCYGKNKFKKKKKKKQNKKYKKKEELTQKKKKIPIFFLFLILNFWEIISHLES